MRFARFAAIVLGALIAVLAGAPTASAHTPSVVGGCVDGRAVLTVELERYDGRRANSVSVTDGDRSIEDERFRGEFRRAYSESGTVPHAFVVTVLAWDDPRGARGWSFSREVTVHKCATPPIPPAPPAPPPAVTTTTVEVPVATTPTAVGTTTATTPPLTFHLPSTQPKPVVRAAGLSDLPRPGPRVTVPLVLSAVVLVGGLVVLVVLRRRLRR
ncbi:hypothetical protein [Saccharothrix syringae]|uniref:LPXTG cell wall anchor domain-containing protein n=1 Tax=Saccharothrix syringae TaxID=103733 RepID=A0A5Q0H7J3_SACSY|nr:hypothetical protein [Saccharothrix syringae]QFZ22171.1 hypothetical protein EKG83_36425 [Saccharothrix syringae]